MWPYVNQEDLSKSKNLLLLLNARGRHHPSCFVAADCDTLHFGIICKAVIPIFLNQYTMFINGAAELADYGRMVSWDDDPNAFDLMYTQIQFAPGEGLLVLEAQERVLAFLVNCCGQILHDVQTDLPHSVQPEPPFTNESETEGFETLRVMADEAPYKVPARMDLARVEFVLQARVGEAEDHLLFLREDPGYFASIMFDAKEHRQEIIKDRDGKKHPIFDLSREHLFWTRVVGNVMLEAYMTLEVYSELLRQAQNLRRLHAQYSGSLVQTETLPDELLSAILKFRHHLTQAALGPLSILKMSAPASPPLRHLFAREPPKDPNSSMIQLYSKGKRTDVENRVIYLLSVLWENGHPLLLMRLPLILDELERLVQDEPLARDLVSAQVASTISDLSILTQCKNQLDLFQPWARAFENLLVDREDQIQEEYASSTRVLAKLVNALQESTLRTMGKFADPSDGRFKYPSEKRRTRENVQVLRQAEEHLNKIWVEVDDKLKRSGVMSEMRASKSALGKQDIRRTPPWVEPEITIPIRSGKEGKARTDDKSKVDYKPLATITVGDKATGSPPLYADGPKVKPKTTGHASTDSQETPPPEAPQAIPIPAERIPVDARALKVFRTVFYSPEVTSTPGEVSWTDFLYAMRSTGQFAAEHLNGSAWQFRRVGQENQSSILFHEPHPKGKIPFETARRHGRRLNRRYGWVGDTFVLKGDKA